MILMRVPIVDMHCCKPRASGDDPNCFAKVLVDLM